MKVYLVVTVCNELIVFSLCIGFSWVFRCVWLDFMLLFVYCLMMWCAVLDSFF